MCASPRDNSTSVLPTEEYLLLYKGAFSYLRIVNLFPFPFSLQNEMDDVPFFDIQLPYELAINIFQYLDRKELGRCAQVSDY